jgi:hypothetical protein
MIENDYETEDTLQDKHVLAFRKQARRCCLSKSSGNDEMTHLHIFTRTLTQPLTQTRKDTLRTLKTHSVAMREDVERWTMDVFTQQSSTDNNDIQSTRVHMPLRRRIR